jgi:hypothetical protein
MVPKRSLIASLLALAMIGCSSSPLTPEQRAQRAERESRRANYLHRAAQMKSVSSAQAEKCENLGIVTDNQRSPDGALKSVSRLAAGRGGNAILVISQSASFSMWSVSGSQWTVTATALNCPTEVLRPTP